MFDLDPMTYSWLATIDTIHTPEFLDLKKKTFVECLPVRENLLQFSHDTVTIYNSLAKTVLFELDHTSEDADRGSLLGAEKVTDALTTACDRSVKLMYNSAAAIAL